MNTSRLSSQALLKGFLILAVMLTAFQSLGAKALAIPRRAPSVLLEAGNPPTLACTPPSTPPYCNIQVILLIDDSGSMRINDPQANRQKAAMHLVDVLAIGYYRLAANAKNDLSALPNVQVAVIHFSNRTISNSGWFQVHPSSRTEWETQRTSLFGMIDRRAEIHEANGTLFEEAFSVAADLFRSAEQQAVKGPCQRRSILLFSDGTPEDLTHGIFQASDLDGEMAKVTSIVQKIPGLDGIYVTVFKFNSRYWSKAIEEHWLKAVGSAAQYELPPVMVIEGKDDFVPLTSRMDEIAASLSEVKPDQVPVDLSAYQGLRLELEDQPAPAREGQPSHIRFKLLNDSGSVVTSGGDAKSSLKLDITVTQLAQDSPLNLTQEGNNYQLSWTPASVADNQFKVVGNLIDANGAVFLNCSGLINVPVEAPPNPNPAIVLSLLIGSPRFPNHETVILPMQLNYKGTAARVDSLDWNHSAIDMRSGQPLTTTVKASGTAPGEYELTVESIGNASKIQVAVSMIAGIGNQTITSPEATTTVDIPKIPTCACDGISAFWFWPLAIMLTGLVILLLVLRVWPQWTEIHVQGEKRYIIRKSEWPMLFVPFLVLLVLLVVNRVWWCCILPPWLFLVLALLAIGFWLLTNPWYKRKENPIIEPIIHPLNWVVGAADEPGAELSLQPNSADDQPVPVPAPSRLISPIRTAPLTWTLRDGIEDEIKVSRQS